jgi:polysaccharide export outer membrane protein
MKAHGALDGGLSLPSPGDVMRPWRALAALMACIAVLAVGLPAALAVGPDYRVGTDDVLAISVWDQKDLDQVVAVRPDGKISLPLVGEVEAGGLTVAELSSRLTTLYARTVRGAQVTVSVREIRSRPVFFLGGVVRPGPLQLTQDLTLLQALSSVGGPIAAADLESAFVLRGQTKIPVNVQMMLQRGDQSQNLRLQPGDTVVIPAADAVYVQGEVKTPGPVKYARGMTVVQAIAAAGGFTPLASERRVTVVRGDTAKKEVLRVNVRDIMSDPEAQDVPLKPNDVITVPQRLF